MNKSSLLRWLTPVAFVLCAGSAFGQEPKVSLHVGDMAPAINVAGWAKGEPVKKFEAGKIYVVEFWATWCPPCRESIPHLTEMAKKFGDKVAFTGVSAFESQQDEKDTSYQKTVRDFVDKMGDKMVYHVAYDTPDKVMAKTWMIAAGQNGIPTAFIVGKDQKIAWIGHPMAGLEETLDKVIAGNYDPKQAAADEKAKKTEDEKEKTESEKKPAGEDESNMQQMMKPIAEALQSDDPDQWAAAFDQVIAKNPSKEFELRMAEYSVMLQRGETKQAVTIGKQLVNGKAKDNAVALNEIAWFMVGTQFEVKNPDYNFGIETAKKAIALLKNDDLNRCMTLDTLAYAMYKSGDLKGALATQKESVALIAKLGSKINDDAKKEIMDRMTQYEKESAKK